MRVLWFSITSSLYGTQQNKFHGGGWIESLQRSVMAHDEIDLGIVFLSSDETAPVKQEGRVTYYPLYIKRSFMDRIKDLYTSRFYDTVAVKKYIQVINDFKPDLIQAFGSEWNFGLIKPYIHVPLIIHMQGFWPEYRNSCYPPGFSKFDHIFGKWYKPTSIITRLLEDIRSRDRAKREEKILSINVNYFGRTEWDKAITRLFNPKSHYYYCSEALRSVFVNENRKWEVPSTPKITFVTTGAGHALKGFDLVLKTAKLLKDHAPFDFEWLLCGPTSDNMRLFEKKTNIKCADVNVSSLGVCSAESVKDTLLNAFAYIHPSYIDNSPNAICEAQYIGLPVLATNVGGVASLFPIDYPKEALVPTNDPYLLASRIIEFVVNKNKLKQLSEMNYMISRERHNDEAIYASLVRAYNLMLNDNDC